MPKSSRVARLPDGSDPHDVLKSEGPEPLKVRVDDATAYLTFLIEDLRPNAPDIDSTQKSERITQILEVIRSIPDNVIRHSECATLASQTGIPLDVLWQKVRPVTGAQTRIKATADLGTLGNSQLLSGSELVGWDRRLLQVLVQDSDFKSLIFRDLDEEFLDNPRTRRIFNTFKLQASRLEQVDFHSQIADLTEEDRHLLRGLAVKDDPPPTEKGASDLIRRLETQHLTLKTSVLQREIALATPQSLEQTELIIEKKEISERITRLAASLRSKGKPVGN